MNQRNLFISSLLLALTVLTGCGLRTYRAPLKAIQNQESIETIPSIELMTKTNVDGSFAKGSYSFYFLSQDTKIHNNVVDIEFLDVDGVNPTINTQIYPDQIGHIVDLGLTSCKAFPNKNEQQGTYPGRGHSGLPYVEDRTLDPIFWLQYSDMFAKLKDQANGPTVKAEVGHCYILQRTNSNYQVIAAFRIKEYIKARSVKIDEVEVFSKQVFQN